MVLVGRLDCSLGWWKVESDDDINTNGLSLFFHVKDVLAETESRDPVR